MESPNKIWLSKFEEDPGDNEYGIFEQWSLEPISNAENEEYIRKDALLKFAKHELDVWNQNFEAAIENKLGEATKSTCKGCRLALESIINQLNSM